MGDRAWDSTWAADLTDEHPEAYEDIRAVMADQSDLVEVVHELHSVLNLKGT
jgi:RNA-splicing ligase RtcB